MKKLQSEKLRADFFRPLRKPRTLLVTRKDSSNKDSLNKEALKKEAFNKDKAVAARNAPNAFFKGPKLGFGGSISEVQLP